MKAAVLEELNRPLKLYDLMIPKLEYGQVLVKIFYSGLCHSQLMEVRGKRGEDKYLPHLLGHEATAEVIEIGIGVKKVKKGDKVILTWIQANGIDANPPKYLYNDKIINAGKVTTFNEYAIVSENRVILLPEGLPLDVGVLFGCAIPTGMGIVMNQLKPKSGSRVAIFGLGGIGMSALLAIKFFEPSMLIAVDIEDKKLELAKEFGATNLINANKDESSLVKNIKDISNGGVDYVVEATGLSRMIEKGFEALNRTGTIIFASHPKYGDKISIDPFDLIAGKRILGSWGGATNPDVDIPKFVKFYIEKKIPLEKMVSKPYELDEINQALDDLEDRKILRGLIKINGK